MCLIPHLAYVKWTGVTALPIGDGVNKLVLELPRSAQEVGLHEIHHSVVCEVGREEGEKKGEAKGGQDDVDYCV